MIADKKVETVTTTTHILTLTEKEMNTVMIAVGAITPSELQRSAIATKLEVLGIISDNDGNCQNELHALYYSLQKAVSE